MRQHSKCSSSWGAPVAAVPRQCQLRAMSVNNVAQKHRLVCHLPAAHAAEEAHSSTATAELQRAAAGRAKAAGSLTVYFREEDVLTGAAAGEDLVEVAQRCGVTIPTGCWQGNCGVCEVEVYKYTGDAEQDTAAAAATPAVVRACITKLPPGYSRVEVAQMQDAIWGLDGFDT